MTASGGNSYAYDANGNMTTRTISGQGTSILTYDAAAALWARLVNVSGATNASFVYDGDGVRVKGTVNGVTSYYPNRYYEVTGGVIKKYYYAGDQRIAMKEGGANRILLGDHLGSTAYTVSGASETGELRYKAFGATRFTSGTTPTTYRFTGQREEAGLGLYYYGARWYDPALDHFLQPDTLVPDAGNTLDYNRYGYGRFNPLRYTDPSGHAVQPDCIHPNCEPLELLSYSGVPEPVSEVIDAVAFLGCMLAGCVADTANDGIRTPTLREAATAVIAGPLGPEAAVLASALDSLAASSGCSFSADTLVTTVDGLVPIGELETGDRVLAYNQALGSTGFYTITATFAHLDPVLVALTLDAEQVLTTPEHPFQMANETWVPAGALQVGDQLRRADGTTSFVRAVEIVHRPQMMYNLTVANAHTFFVGHSQWLVHNACNAIVNGQRVSASSIGAKLANQADAIYRSVSRTDKKYTTVAVTIVDGKTYVAVNSGAPASAVSRVQSITKANGWTFVHDPSLTEGAGHAEQVLYNYTGKVATSIGVSHVDGPCREYCQPYFNGTGVEITYTGEYKR